MSGSCFIVAPVDGGVWDLLLDLEIKLESLSGIVDDFQLGFHVQEQQGNAFKLFVTGVYGVCVILLEIRKKHRNRVRILVAKALSICLYREEDVLFAVVFGAICR